MTDQPLLHTNPWDERPTGEEYTLVRDGDPVALECWPRTTQGAINAVNRAHWFSTQGAPCEVLRPDGRLLCRYKDGERADLDPVTAQRVAKVAGHM